MFFHVTSVLATLKRRVSKRGKASGEGAAKPVEGTSGKVDRKSGKQR